MAGLLPPVIATLIADTKEYQAKMAEAEATMTKFGTSSMTTGEKMTAFGKKATTAVAGVGIAMVAYGVEKALKYNEALDKIQNQAGASASELDYLKGVILTVSSQTAISSDQIAGAFLQVEKAGIRGAAAYKLVDNAAKAAAITGGDVAAIATTIVAAQSLQITKGQSVAQVTDTLVKANQNHIGSLDNLVGLLKGKVGGALAAYGINLGEAAAVSDVASKAGYTNARSMMTLATGLGKVENPTTAQTKALKALGINADALARTARHPGTGLIDTLKALEVQSKKTGVPLEKLISVTFGSGAVGLVSALAKQLPALTSLNTSLQSSSAKGLDTAFGITSEQLNYKIQKIKTQLTNALTGIGITLLPTVATLAGVVTTVTAYLQKHPIAMTFLSDSLVAAIGLALSTKLAGFGLMVARSFGASAALAEFANPIGMAIAVAMYSTWSLLNSKQLPKTSLAYWINKALGLNATTDLPAAPKSFGKAIDVVSKQKGSTTGYGIYQAQLNAADAYFKSQHMAEYQANGAFTTAFKNALNNFTTGNLQGKYSVVVRVK